MLNSFKNKIVSTENLHIFVLQTYDVPINAGKRSRSFSCDDYSDWNPIKKSTSIVSFTSDQQVIRLFNDKLVKFMLQ